MKRTIAVVMLFIVSLYTGAVCAEAVWDYDLSLSVVVRRLYRPCQSGSSLGKYR